MTCSCPKYPRPPDEKPYFHHRECPLYQAWRARVAEDERAEARLDLRLKAWILDHAAHPVGCKARAIDDDRRIANTLYPCSCGLSAILDVLEPGVKHQLDEEDEEDADTPVDLDSQTALLQGRLVSGPRPKSPPRPR